MNLNDLKTMSASQVAAHNAELAFLAPRVYQIGQTNYVLRRTREPFDGTALAMSFGGRPVMVGLSNGAIDLLFTYAGIVRAELAPEWLSYLLRSHLAAFLPASLTLLEVAPNRPFPHAFEALVYGSNAKSGIVLATDHADPFAVLETIDSAVVGRTPAPFANCPITLPLIASTFNLPAADLLDLQAGDVLFV